mgnify:CR=1 FL=1|tara:strand:- start:1114 stop:1467 length:354 start_codon:yes stop_codon:yes gene_type:complete
MKNETEINKELRKQKRIFLAIRLVEHLEETGDNDSDKYYLLKQYLKDQNSNYDDQEHLSKIMVLQWVLYINPEVPKLQNHDKFIEQLAEAELLNLQTDKEQYLRAKRILKMPLKTWR